MKLIPIEEVQPGEKLGRSLFYKNGVTMLRKGISLNKSIIQKLKNRGFSRLFVYSKHTKDIKAGDLLSESLRNDLRNYLRNVYVRLRRKAKKELDLPKLFRNLTTQSDSLHNNIDRFKNKLGKDLIPEDTDSILADLISNLPPRRDVYERIGSPCWEKTWLLDHSVDVTVWALLVARQSAFSMEDLKKIALGALFHDVGYALFKPEKLEERNDLEESEKKHLQNHPILGYIFLRSQSKSGLLSAHIAYQHHERTDGSGHPRGLKGGHKLVTDKKQALRQDIHSIHRFAHIIAVADAYCRRAYGTPWRSPIPPDRAYSEIRNMQGESLNDEVSTLFFNILPRYPISTPVVCTSGTYEGYRGVVSKVFPESPNTPEIRFLYNENSPLEEPVNVHTNEEDITISAITSLRGKSDMD